MSSLTRWAWSAAGAELDLCGALSVAAAGGTRCRAAASERLRRRIKSPSTVRPVSESVQSKRMRFKYCKTLDVSVKRPLPLGACCSAPEPAPPHDAFTPLRPTSRASRAPSAPARQPAAAAHNRRANCSSSCQAPLAFAPEAPSSQDGEVREGHAHHLQGGPRSKAGTRRGARREAGARLHEHLRPNRTPLDALTPRAESDPHGRERHREGQGTGPAQKCLRLHRARQDDRAGERVQYGSLGAAAAVLLKPAPPRETRVSRSHF